MFRVELGAANSAPGLSQTFEVVDAVDLHDAHLEMLVGRVTRDEGLDVAGVAP